MPSQKLSSLSPSTAGASSPCPTSPPPPPAEPVEKEPKLEENGTTGIDADANANGNDSGAMAGAGEAAAGSDSETEDAAAPNSEFVPVKLAHIRNEVQCPICLGIIRKTRTGMECLHRFYRNASTNPHIANFWFCFASYN